MSGRKRKRVRATKPDESKMQKSRKGYNTFTRMGVPSGVPIQNVVSMRYCTFLQQSTGLTPTVNFFRANGCHDPDETLGGHQPMGWNEMTQFYNHYVVLGSKITVTFCNVQNDHLVCGIFLDDNAALSYTSYEGLIEAKKGKYVAFVGGSQGSRKISANFSAKKFFNVKDPEDNTQIQAAVGADPVNQGHFAVWSQCLDKSNALTVECVVVIDYIVKFMEPKDLGQS